MSDFDEMELGIREFLIFEFTDKGAPSIFGSKVIKQNIEGTDRCLTCFKKEFGVTLCDCKGVSFCSVKCKAANTKHL
jgi:hypothetical protein